jgi:hypothetical protein
MHDVRGWLVWFVCLPDCGGVAHECLGSLSYDSHMAGGVCGTR